jgi:hypothetical protein
LHYHDETIHKEKSDHIEDKLRENKFIFLKLCLQQQQNIFTVANKSSETAVYSSFAVSQIIAK